MAHAVQSALQQRLEEIGSLLRPFEPLFAERAQIEKLLAHYDSVGGALPTTTGEAILVANNPPARSGHFMAIPTSKSSQVLAAAKEMLQKAPDHQLPFISIFHALPRGLMGPGRNAREHVRGILQKGERVGIEYVDANVVRLTA